MKIRKSGISYAIKDSGQKYFVQGMPYRSEDSVNESLNSGSLFVEERKESSGRNKRKGGYNLYGLLHDAS